LSISALFVGKTAQQWGEIGLVRTLGQNKSADFHLHLGLCANVAKLYNDAADMTHAYEVHPRKDHRGTGPLRKPQR
jgi:hypothetical protein